MGNEKLMVGNGFKLAISQFGNSFLPYKNSSKPLLLNNILHVPHITKNLFSISQFTKYNNVLIELCHDYCISKDKAQRKLWWNELLGMVSINLISHNHNLHSPSHLLSSRPCFLCYKSLVFLNLVVKVCQSILQ